MLGGQSAGGAELAVAAGPIAEAGLFRENGEQGGRSAAGLVQAVLPFTDSLLPGAQFVGQLLLGQSQVIPQSADTPAIPIGSFRAFHEVHVRRRAGASQRKPLPDFSGAGCAQKG